MDEFLPLTTFDGATTRVDLDRLTPFERVLFDLVFPGFSETPDYNKNARAALERGLAPQTPYNYRRFAGGPDLPPGSYSAVGSSSGDATNILLHELLFYTDPKIIVGFHVVTGRHSWLETGAESPMGRFTDFRPDPSSVLVLFHSSPASTLCAFLKPHLRQGQHRGVRQDCPDLEYRSTRVSDTRDLDDCADT